MLFCNGSLRAQASRTLRLRRLLPWIPSLPRPAAYRALRKILDDDNEVMER